MGKDYKWELFRGSQKWTCPKCGQKRFKPYVSALDHKTIADVTKYGRCDREQNCGYNVYPGKEVSTDGIQRIEQKKEPPLYFLPQVVVIDFDTPLFAWASALLGIDAAKRAWEMYKVGADGRRTLFWQISKDGEVRAGKSIPYLKNGHRDKADPFPANWMHAKKRYEEWKKGKELHQCLFGEHLLNEFPDKPIMVVESEKSALIMSVIWSRYLWVASGGSGNLSADKLNVLRGRNVTLMPDHGKYNDWSRAAVAYGYKIESYIELHPVFEGCDILDYFA